MHQQIAGIVTMLVHHLIVATTYGLAMYVVRNLNPLQEFVISHAAILDVIRKNVNLYHQNNMRKRTIVFSGLLTIASLSIAYSSCQTTHTNGYCHYKTKPDGGVTKTCVEKPSEETNGRCLFKKSEGEEDPIIG